MVQRSRQEQTVRPVAEGQAPDLLAVDGDVLTVLQVDSAHHLNSVTSDAEKAS